VKKKGSVLVMGASYSVEYFDLIEDSDHTYGDTDGHEKRIRISTVRNNTKNKLKTTLLHEITHAVLAESGLTQILGDATEEAVVCAIENGLGRLVEFKPTCWKKMEGGDE